MKTNLISKLKQMSKSLKFLLFSLLLFAGCAPPQSSSPFKYGDKVRDKNGGPTMNVGNYSSDTMVYVYWFDKNDAPQKEAYDPNRLVKVEE